MSDPVPDTGMAQDEAGGDVQSVVTGRARAWFSRIGCAGGLLLWAFVLLIPGTLFVLAIQGEIALWHGGGFPAGEEHPMLQVKLLMDADTRGLNITSSALSATEDRAAEEIACIQTHVRYVLWQGTGDNAAYCDCYARVDVESPWALRSTYAGTCDADDPTSSSQEDAG